MSNGTTGAPPGSAPAGIGPTARRILQVLLVAVAQAGALFLTSGRLDWLMAWLYIAVYLGAIAMIGAFVISRDPGLAAERARVRPDAKTWDRWLAAIVGFYGPLVSLIVAGIDRRFGWSDAPPAAQVLALALLALGYLVVGWAMSANRFFSGVVRIQHDRGHTVQTAGPYRYVRHPGYAGMALYIVATPFVLGSLWALLPAIATIAVLVARTALEDATLQAELDGYRDYAARVRYRLLPGIW